MIGSEGKQGCQCIDSQSALESLVDRSCLRSDRQGGVMLSARGPCVSYSYGSSGCMRHDFIHDPKCQLSGNSSQTEYPDYCIRSWCFVEAKECMLTNERVYRSNMFLADEGVDLFYSYSTCASSEDDWIKYQQQNTLGGISMVATVPKYYKTPFMYKSNSSGEVIKSAGDEYYDNSVPYEGVLINYMQALQKTAGGDFNVTYTYGSKASRLLHPTSSYTAVVQDIKNGLVDMAVGPFWITGERLKLVSFTVPLQYDRTVLVIPKPGINDSLSAQVRKVLDPFTVFVWGLIIALIVFTALLSVWFSERVTNRRARRQRQPRQIRRPKNLVYARWAIDEFLQKGTFFCSAGVEQDKSASLPAKLLMFGFSFFILIVISAYVANLAAFLTNDVPDYVGTVEATVESGLTICAHPALKNELEIAWPEAKFYVHTLGKEVYGMLEDYNDKKCSVLAVGRLNNFGDLDLMNKFCESNLVFTDSLFVENPVAFPIRSELASGLSYWMYQSEKYHAITLESVQQEYDTVHKRQPECNFDFTTQNIEVDKFTKISAKNLFFPTIFFFGFAVLAIILQLWHQRAMKSGKRRTMIGRLSSLHLMTGDASARDVFRENKKDDDSLHSFEEQPLKTEAPEWQNGYETSALDIFRENKKEADCLPQAIEEQPLSTHATVWIQRDASIARGLVSEDDEVQLDNTVEHSNQLENEPGSGL